MEFSSRIGAAFAGVSCGCLLLAACSSSASPPAASTQRSSLAAPAGRHAGKAAGGATLDACTLLTSSDVHAVLGGTVSAANPHDPDITDGPGCEYVVTDSTLGAKADVLDELPNNLPATTIESGAKRPLGTEVSVSGIGDAATYDPSGDGVLFAKNNRSFLVEPILFGTTTPKPLQVKAAIIALARDVANKA